MVVLPEVNLSWSKSDGFLNSVIEFFGFKCAYIKWASLFKKCVVNIF